MQRIKLLPKDSLLEQLQRVELLNTIFGLTVISDNPDQPTVEHFQMLRRQWASKAQMLMATLDGLPDADGAAVQGT